MSGKNMTREEEIDNAKTAFYERVLEDDYYYDPRDCFEEGAKWADSHPKSPWISVDDDLPCNHEEMVHTNYTDRVLVSSRNGFSEVAFMCIIEDVWEWNTLMQVSYWMPIPKTPKE